MLSPQVLKEKRSVHYVHHRDTLFIMHIINHWSLLVGESVVSVVLSTGAGVGGGRPRPLAATAGAVREGRGPGRGRARGPGGVWGVGGVGDRLQPRLLSGLASLCPGGLPRPLLDRGLLVPLLMQVPGDNV